MVDERLEAVITAIEAVVFNGDEDVSTTDIATAALAAVDEYGKDDDVEEEDGDDLVNIAMRMKSW